jgi:beta-mannanase
MGRNKDILPTYSVYSLNELVDWDHALYHGKPCKIEKDSNRKHWSGEDPNDQYVTIWIKQTTLRVHISELDFCYNLKSSNCHE